MYLSLVAICGFPRICGCLEAAPRGCKAVRVNRKRFGTESNVIYQIESNRLAKVCTQEAVPVEPHAKEVMLQTYGHDKYKRTIADVLLPDGTNVNYQLVKDGWCWWFRRYAPEDSELEQSELEAREAKKGLWVDPQPVPPWEWRKRR
jgi:Staphylococcal nuclease homologue